ncbi:retropepsin-like aspartic protease family protein [Oceanomicrobium pacificus]|uniref:TIGR02281 family clan AA aspartic protease n=1 Tax=Oceanomicrobium pacificus TaxID=2692916 RepID=A0A6B0TW44_9RHOB|nr:TIGR02281 family clan AA aspartic protease [Oceanomicrobium pacificus]MXU65462.1 TIGR02281 family clan AA aspartic protease [Oceanomicrobium pacificus]
MNSRLFYALTLVGLAVVFRDELPALVSGGQDMVWLGLVLLLLGGFLIGRFAHLISPHLPVALMNSLMIVTVLGLLAALEFRDEISDYARIKAGRAEPTPVVAVASIGAETSIKRAWDGHFRALASINGTDVGLLVDTGASIVLLRYDDAERIGVDMDALDFSVPVTTAGGRSKVAPYTFDMISVDGVRAQNIRGAIAQRGELHSSLLGMSFLEELQETVIRKDRMLLRN